MGQTGGDRSGEEKMTHITAASRTLVEIPLQHLSLKKSALLQNLYYYFIIISNCWPILGGLGGVRRKQIYN